MINFKTFIMNEDIGLGNIGRSVDRLFSNKQFANQVGSYVNTDYSMPSPEGYIGDPDFMPRMPATNLTIPSTEKTGKITVLLAKKNPIFMKLSDGTELNFTYEQYKRIHGSEPAIGKTMTVIFQRRPNDRGEDHSKIDHAIVRD